MKRTAASPRLILLASALMVAVLILPWVNPAAVAAPAKGCPHCAAAAAGVASGPCCPPEMPGPCGDSGQGGGLGCRGAGVSLVVISPSAVLTPYWQVSFYLPLGVILGDSLFPPQIFHPPEPRSLAARV